MSWSSFRLLFSRTRPYVGPVCLAAASMKVGQQMNFKPGRLQFDWTFLPRPAACDSCMKGRPAAGPEIPQWLHWLWDSPEHYLVMLREWEDVAWRQANGWQGTDLIHHYKGDGVRILAYFWNPSNDTLSGVVHFGKAAESHPGLCHGGAMTSLLDDFCGHCAFLASKSPWSGATVQVNCKMSKPVRIGQILLITGGVPKRQGRKVHIAAKLVDEAGVVYAELDGISIDGVKMSDSTNRTWQVIEKDRIIRDSSWGPT